MKTTNLSLAALALTATLGLGASGAAQAGDVFWSIGVAQPGIQIGVSNLPPAPVIVAPPVVVHPRPVYVPPPRVVYVPPRPVYYGYGYGYGRWDRHDHGRGDDRRGYAYRDDRRGGRDLHGDPRR